MNIYTWGAAAAWALLGITASAGLGGASEPEAATHEIACWPQWRGPTRDSQAPDGPAWPETLAEDRLTPLWRVELGPGYSGPIVAGDRVFVTETADQKLEVVRALSRSSGAELWRAEWEGAMTVPFFAWANGSWIRATPAFDGESLYVAGMRDVLVCLNGSDGTERWKADFCERYQTPLPSFGFVSSPLIDGEHVYVQAGAGVCKLNKATGETVWRSLADEGGLEGGAFSSPVLADVHGVRQLLVQTREELAALDVEQGQELWRQEVPAFRGMNILTPTVWNDAIFTSAYGGKSFLYRVSGAAGAYQLDEAWSNKVQGYMSSPVLIDGHIYVHLRNQRFACLELSTGQQKWITKPFGQYWSMVAQGDKILALDERGELLLIRAQPTEFELLDRREISKTPAWAHLAVCGEEIFIRALDGIAAYCFK